MKVDIKDVNDKFYFNQGTTQVIDGYNSLFYNTNPGNCKLCTLDNIGYFLNIKNIETIKKVLNKGCKLMFNVTLNYEHQVDFLEKHFKLISKTTIPVGYSGQNQYHCCFFTNNYYSDKDNYEKRVKEQQNKPIVIDNIDTIFNNLKNIDSKSLEKIKNYKQEWRSKKLLKSLLEK